MTIADFLLARIAEDQAAAQTAARLTEYESQPAPVLYGMGMRVSMSWGLQVDPSRVLAECEAKRHIVEEAVSYNAQHGDSGVWAFEIALNALAMPYADHLDYKPEWRP